MTRIWGHAEDEHGRLPYSWVSGHAIEPDPVDGSCTGCGGRIALVWTETWDCGCVFAVAEGALVSGCEAHAGAAASTGVLRTSPADDLED